jgi:hypothetical protein
VVPLIVLALGLARPPAAYVYTGARRVPLAVSSWCWGSRCGAPIAASGRAVVVRRNAAVRVKLTFAPTTARVAVSGVRLRVTRRGRVISWRATRAGGMTIGVTAAHGWVTYVGRLVVR